MTCLAIRGRRSTAKSDATAYLNFGTRIGNDGLEGYSDMILPLASSEQDIVFFNPRVSLAGKTLVSDSSVTVKRSDFNTAYGVYVGLNQFSGSTVGAMTALGAASGVR